jgi:peptide/nickel transport system permease protein
VLGFLTRRLLLGVCVLFGFSFVSFCVFAWQFPSPLQGRPVLGEYWRWLRGVPSGRSLREGLYGPILPSLLSGLGHTLVLLVFSLVLVVVFSVLLGTVGAVVRGSALDLLLRGLSYAAWGVPPFLLALLVEQAVTSFGSLHGWGPFPVAGWPGFCPAPLGLDAGTLTPCPAAGSGLVYLVNVFRHVTLPACALAVGFVGLHGRYLRSSLAVALDAPFTVTARAKGLPERQVVLRHALRNSLVSFADFGAIFGAALAVDWIFQLNGLGSLFIRELGINNLSAASASLDVYAVELLLLATALLVLASSVLSELVVVVLDPRARLE